SEITINKFYIEMNEIIHENSNTNVEDENFEVICAYVDELILMVKPKKLIFIALDGVAPRAKMNEQRNRRFKNTLKLSNSEFDRNSITPGTKFMEDLSKYIKKFICDKITNDDKWRNIKIIYSGHDVPGEGEHKIMEYIRHSESENDCIYGRDSDLILLGLLHYKQNLKILSSEEFSLSKSEGSPKSRVFEIKFLKTLRGNIEKEFSELWKPNPLSFEFNVESIIKDLILLVLFTGNDFIPTLSDIKINNKGLDAVISIYKEVLKECGGYIMISGTLNIERLKMIFKKLSFIEKEIFKSRDKNIDHLKSYEKNKAIETKSNNDEKDFFEWKEAYYLNNMMVKVNRENLIRSYIKGLQWVLSYYEGAIKSYRWFYPEYYSPLISGKSQIRLLPEAYQSLMNNSSIKEFYPETFSTDKNNIIKIPFIGEEELLSLLEPLENKLLDEEKQINKFRKALLFEYDNSNQRVSCADIE
ncbi:6721_t:CDS:2, partial [Cetraspora pellucida]